jgi:hypothetical protein
LKTTVVNTDVLHCEAFKLKFERVNDRRYKTGARIVLETLGIPFPEVLICKPPGVKPGKEIAAAFAADMRDHRDITFTATGERRAAPDGKLPPSRFRPGQ